MLVLMMDEGSVVERAHITVVPLTAVLRIYLLPKSKCALSSKNPESRFRMCFGGYGLSAHFTKKRKKKRFKSNPLPPNSIGRVGLLAHAG